MSYLLIRYNKQKLLNKRYYFVIYQSILFMIIILSLITSFENNQRNIKMFQSEIKLIIKGRKNDCDLLGVQFYKEPSKVFVNGTLKNDCKKKCNLENEINNVTIEFKGLLNSTEKMFRELTDLIEVDLSNLDTSEVTSMSSMFYKCSNLERIDFGNINTSLVKDMNHLFYYCKKLEYINLSNFDTSSVTNMRELFSHCESLKLIDVSSFNTSNVEIMYDLFAYCYNLTSLNVSNFDTSRVIDMQGMFTHLYSLKYLDLSNFDTSKVTNMRMIFRKCSSLMYLDISNFNVNANYFKDNSLFGLDSLIVLNLNSFQFIRNESLSDPFNDLKNNILYCSEDTNLIRNMNNLHNNCSDLCFQKNIKIILKENRCIEFCNDSDSKFEFGNICYDKCPIGFSVLINDEYKCLDEIPKYYYLDANDNIYKYKQNIYLKIAGKNEQKFLTHYFYLNPKEVWVNGVLKPSCTKTCDLENDINNITISFDNQLESFDYMFNGITNIIEIDLSDLDTSKVTNMSHMFNGCTNLERIYFGNINTSLVKDMKYLFHNCKKLEYINLSNFDTSSVTSIQGIFRNCESLKSIDVSKFNTSKVVDMIGSFAYCYNLTSLNVSNFDTSKVTDMQGMFCHLYNITYLEVRINTLLVKNMLYMFENTNKLTSLDLSSFNTSSVVSMRRMFYRCESLKSIDVSSFNTSNVESMLGLFAYCYQLTSLDLSNFDTSSVVLVEQMFYSCENLKTLNIPKFNTSKVENFYYFFANCYQLTSLNLSNFNTSKVTNMTGMFYNLYNLKYLDLSNFNTSKVNDMQHLFYQCYSLIYLNLKNFKINEAVNYSNIFHKIPESTKICIEDIETKQLLLEANRYSDCSDICFKDNAKIDLFQNKCVEYVNETQIIFVYSTYYYNGCSFGYQILINDTYKCVYDIPKNYCLDKTDNIYKECNNGICFYQNSNDIISSDKRKCYFSLTHDDLNKDIYNIFINDINLTELEEGNDITFPIQNIYYSITTTSNQRNNIGKKNITYIDLGYCEKKLKEEYGIPSYKDLYIFKIDVYLEGMKIPKVEYEVYYPLNNNNLTKLDLSKCKNIKMDIFIPIDIQKEDLDKHNASSGYYNDICYTLTSESGTDKALKDRKNEFIEKNLTVCEENCEFTNYSETQKIGTCSCFVKFKVPLISEIKIDKDLLISNFKDIKNIANIKMLKCLNLFLDKKNIFKNYANYLFILLFILSFITLVVFPCYSYQKIKNTANEINNSINTNNEIISITNDINQKKIQRKNNIKKKTIFNNNGESKRKMVINKKNRIKKNQTNSNQQKSLKLKNQSTKDKITKLNVNNNIISNNHVSKQLLNKKKKKNLILTTNKAKNKVKNNNNNNNNNNNEPNDIKNI